MHAIARTASPPAPRLETETLESGVRYYSRIFPARIRSAEGSILCDVHGGEWVDFFAGACALNYGHNHPEMKARVISYLQSNGIVHSLDMDTEARSKFLHDFHEVVLAPRRLPYRIQFTGPTGTNCVEAALKLARKVTGRRTVAAFTGAFHGMSLASLAVTASASHRHALSGSLHDVVRLPFDGFLGDSGAELRWIEAMLSARGAGVDKPAAFIFECVQGEGGLNVASPAWAQRVCQIARSLGALIILDEVQTGCGRAGDFFAFEALGIEPDMICLSKSLSGMGVPLAVLLLRPELDAWSPGEHNGTFRGVNLAFIGASTALDLWRSPEFTALVERNRMTLRDRLEAIAADVGPGVCTVRGRGMMLGLKFCDPSVSQHIRQEAFASGLFLENCGPDDEVCKTTPPLNIAADSLERGLAILERLVRGAAAQRPRPSEPTTTTPAAS